MHLEAAVVSQVISCYSTSGHRTSTKQLQRTLRPAIAFTSLQVFPSILAPYSIFLPHFAFSYVLFLEFPNQSLFLNDTGTLSHVMSYPFPFFLFICAAKVFCVAHLHSSCLQRKLGH
jgi:hypothetical protein